MRVGAGVMKVIPSSGWANAYRLHRPVVRVSHLNSARNGTQTPGAIPSMTGSSRAHVSAFRTITMTTPLVLSRVLNAWLLVRSVRTVTTVFTATVFAITQPIGAVAAITTRMTGLSVGVDITAATSAPTARSGTSPVVNVWPNNTICQWPYEYHR
ncbi:unnamed protein product [Medioppia subpectinata]|uniref:Uncharacterized protein n=1 Tax=Medioppia subpectinata TaxID=1979941 RepID=A0A7R9LNT9_9ACAR|nr:unnamed protein product [Medioppia subpectinata]CAG2119915.1 unnamed protein product [Medioppia subpectinata]